MDIKKLSRDFEIRRKLMTPAGQMLLPSIYKQETEARSQWLLKGHILSGRYKIQNQVTRFQEKDERREDALEALKHTICPTPFYK